MGEDIKGNEEASQQTSAQNTGIDQVEEAKNRLRICPKSVLASLEHLRIDRARIKPIESTAAERGGTADVEAAILAPAQSSNSSGPDNNEIVAAKKLRLDAENDDGQALAPFAHEVNLLNSLSHENVVKIIGFVEDVEHGVAWMVFCWEKNGNLREFVRSADWELPERVSLIYDVAGGLSYLHGMNPPICHGDMKSLNILVNSEFRAVITDFGSARPVASAAEPTVRSAHTTFIRKSQENTSTDSPVMESLKVELAPSGEFITMTGPTWTVRWAAPELLAGDLPGLASDIWALGWICWEAVTGKFPFDNLENQAVVILRITRGDLPATKNNNQLKQIQELCNLMEDCWSVDAKSRPTAARCQQIISWMEKVLPSCREGDNLEMIRSSGLWFALGTLHLKNNLIPEARTHLQQSLEICLSVGNKRGEAAALIALGSICSHRCEYSKAEELYIQARDVLSQLGDSLGFATSEEYLGKLYLRRGKYSKAEKSFLVAQFINFHRGDQLGRARIFACWGELYCRKGEFSIAEQSLIEARDIYSQLGFMPGVAGSLKTLGQVYLERLEYSHAEQLFIQARDIRSRMGDQRGFADLIGCLGRVYQARREFSRAEEACLQAKDIYTQIGSQGDLAQSIKSLGEIYIMRYEYSKAEESFIQARDVFTQLGDTLSFGYSIKSLGDVYRMRSEFSKAEASYTQARDIFSPIGDPIGLAQSVMGLGLVYSQQYQYSKAEQSFTQARDIFSRIEDQSGFASSVKSMGDVYYMQAEYSKATQLFIQARDIFSQLQNLFGLAQSLRSLGVTYNMQSEYAKAEESLIQARDISSQIGNQLGFANSIQELGSMYHARGEHSKAEESYLEAQQIYHGVGDMHGSASIFRLLGWLYLDLEKFAEAERLLCEASTIYIGLGLELHVVNCDELLQRVRELVKKRSISRPYAFLCHLVRRCLR